MRRLLLNGCTYLSLGLFRVLLYSVIFAEHAVLAWHRSTVIAEGPTPTIALIAIVIGSAACIAGAFTRIASIAVFVAIKALQPHHLVWYEVDWVMELFSLLYCFAPEQRALSVDAWRRGYGRRFFHSELPWAFPLVVATLMTGVYLDSVWTKVHSEIWRNGNAVWFANYLPSVAGLRLPRALEVRPLFVLLTYGTTLYEALFPLILVRRLRLPFAVGGVLLHTGIAISLPLKYFGLIMAAPILLFTGSLLARGAVGEHPSASRRRRWTYATVVGIYGLLIVRSYVDMKVHGNARDRMTTLLGVHPTGVYADGMFIIQPPVLRFELRTPNGMRNLPSFNREGYTTVGDRWWKSFAFFTRTWPCGRDRVLRHLNTMASQCRSTECVVEVYAQPVALARFDFDPDLIERARKARWTHAATVSWSGTSPSTDLGRFHWQPAAGAAMVAHLQSCGARR